MYPYGKNNLLEKPHAYMYTPFQGEELLTSYASSRRAAMRRHAEEGDSASELDILLVHYGIIAFDRLFDQLSGENQNWFQVNMNRRNIRGKDNRMNKDMSLSELEQSLARLTITKNVQTLDLLYGITATQLLGTQEFDIKVWLDRLVQRFEVTKKIYQSYLPGFRKGAGSTSFVRIYWLFGFTLGLYYVRSGELKYLNTLLKVNDLLCSLPENTLEKEIPVSGMKMILAAEMGSVFLLAGEKEVPIAIE